MKKSNSIKQETRRNPASLVIGVLAILLGGYLVYSTLNNGDQTVFRVEGGNTFVISVADDGDERYQGLSGRSGLDDREGMLFVYSSPSNYSFVMRGMLFSLDFIWIDQHKTITEITPDVSPDTYPEQSFSSELPSQYILEVKAGTAAREGWAVGDKVEFNVD